MKNAKKLVRTNNNLQRSQTLHSSYNLTTLPQERPERDWANIGKKRSTGYPPNNQLSQETTNDVNFEDYKFEMELKIEQFLTTIKSQQDYINNEEKKFRDQHKRNGQLEQEVVKITKLITTSKKNLDNSQREASNLKSQISVIQLENTKKLEIIEDLEQKLQKLELKLENMEFHNRELTTKIESDGESLHSIHDHLSTIEESQEYSNLTSRMSEFDNHLGRASVAQLVLEIENLKKENEDIKSLNYELIDNADRDRDLISQYELDIRRINRANQPFLIMSSSSSSSPEVVRAACDRLQYEAGERDFPRNDHLAELGLPVELSTPVGSVQNSREQSQQSPQQEPELHGKQSWLQWLGYYTFLLLDFLYKIVEKCLEIIRRILD